MEDKMEDGNVTIPAEEVRELIERAVTLSTDYGPEIEAAVKAAADAPLDPDRARRLYTRVLEILRGADADNLTEDERATMAEEVAREVEELVAAVPRPMPAKRRGAVQFIELNGLKPRQVIPTPTFNNKPISMTEGYVDVETLGVWRSNHRLELHVAEFRERNGREPDDDELLKIMQGTIHLPSLNKTDPFTLKPLAQSIARKAVERPPIVSFDGIPKDGNRRIAASLLVLHGKGFSDEQRERARYIRVWRAPKETTDDQFEAIVVAQNFESDHKEEWDEYIKARLVVGEYDLRREAFKGRLTTHDNKRIKEGVGERFGIHVSRVTRYINMVRAAEDFEDYHINDRNRDKAAVRYKANEIFQWFYEIDAGKADEKLARKLDHDDDLKSAVYDMMFDLLDSGAQVRNLHKVLANSEATQLFDRAYALMDKDPDEALELIDAAIALAKRQSSKRRSVGFDQFLKTVIERLGETPPDQWKHVDTELLLEVKRVFESQLGSIEGQINIRRDHGEPIPE
jgi:hypothetical protein